MLYACVGSNEMLILRLILRMELKEHKEQRY
uniref:Uncharacterized protein n=1 Tax=Rhizophora mucronata TaxID=61149 RepID=A0A2P2NKY8_RHIMU